VANYLDRGGSLVELYFERLRPPAVRNLPSTVRVLPRTAGSFPAEAGEE